MRFLKVCYLSLSLLGSLSPSVGYSSEAQVAEESLDIHIPVVDMNDFYDPAKKEAFLTTLYDAMSTVGFFAVKNTGVNAEVIQNAYAQAETFYKKDMAYKELCFVPEMRGQRGFVPGETAKGTKMKDFKEFYHFGREGGTPPNIWPDQPGFKEAITTLYSELEKYVVPLQEAVIASINLRAGSNIPLDYLNRETRGGQSLLRSLYYPALPKDVVENLERPLYWAAPHTDIDYFAILPFATEKGLQAKIYGKWYNVVIPKGAFGINVGDMVENLTNGLLKSIEHRVLAQAANKDRFSMVFFVHPQDTTPLDPIPECIAFSGGVQKYANGTRQEFLWERLIELGIAPGLLPLYAKTGHTERQLEFGRESPQVVEMLIQNNLASPKVLKAVAEKPENYFSTTRICGCQ